jgi:DHA2 family multidrug resistance protein-like MFS transporter
VGAAAFGAASVLAAFSTSAEMLIASRAILGIAGATVAPSTLSLIRNMFVDSHQRTTAIGLWGMSFALGGAIGPLVGGLLLEHFWWGSVFLINVPVMGALLLLGPKLLPEFRDPNAGKPDLKSVGLSLGAVLLAIYGLKQGAQHGFDVAATVAIACGLAFGVAFVRRQMKLVDPLLDLRLFRIPTFSVSVVTNALGGFIAFGTFLYMAQYLQLVYGLSPMSAGLWSLPSSAAVVLGSMFAPAILRGMRPSHAAAGSLVLIASGLALMTQVDASGGLATIVVGSVAFASGFGPLFVLTTDLIVGSAPAERAGAASAISETGAELGGALGIAILGSIGTAVYRSGVIDSVPEGVPASAADAARDTLGGALAVAQQLPANVGAELVETAREAFTQGLQVAAGIGSVIALSMAVLVITMLRNARTGGEPAEADREVAVPALEPATAEC